MKRLAFAAELMEAFAGRTGLEGGSSPRRYLWTDAFAVCNFLALAAAGDPDGERRARALIDQVHDVLGAAADDAGRWLGGVDDESHRRSPTARGLRIGKPLPQRGPDEPFDERAEWQRDGQYFHYLVRWMHALERMAEATGEADYHRWAYELSTAAFDAFVQRDRSGRPLGMSWKMSVDLDRPLVSSMGQHDAIDGWVTSRQLAASAFADDDGKRRLAVQARDYFGLARRSAWASADPLGTGGLLCDAWALWRSERGADPDAVADLVEPAAAGIAHVTGQRLLEHDPARRLGFRELGLAIGLHAADRLEASMARAAAADERPYRLARAVGALRERRTLRERIEPTWSAPEHRRQPAWTEHQDINDVMLATSLVPAGYLGSAGEAIEHVEGATT